MILSTHICIARQENLCMSYLKANERVSFEMILSTHSYMYKQARKPVCTQPAPVWTNMSLVTVSAVINNAFIDICNMCACSGRATIYTHDHHLKGFSGRGVCLQWKGPGVQIPLESYEWLNNWHSHGYYVRPLVSWGLCWNWLACSQYTETGYDRKINNIYLSVAAHTIVYTDPCLQYCLPVAENWDQPWGVCVCVCVGWGGGVGGRGVVGAGGRGNTGQTTVQQWKYQQDMHTVSLAKQKTKSRGVDRYTRTSSLTNMGIQYTAVVSGKHLYISFSYESYDASTLYSSSSIHRKDTHNQLRLINEQTVKRYNYLQPHVTNK